MASSLAFPSQGCYTVILNTFETYVYLTGAFAIGVLAIEVSGGGLGGSPRVCTLSLLPRSTAVAYCKCLLLESFLWPGATGLCLSRDNGNRQAQRGTPPLHSSAVQVCFAGYTTSRLEGRGLSMNPDFAMFRVF